jgi:hypothetical protein
LCQFEAGFCCIAIKIKDSLSFGAPNYVVILWKYGIRKKLLITQNGNFTFLARAPSSRYYCIIALLKKELEQQWEYSFLRYSAPTTHSISAATGFCLI